MSLIGLLNKHTQERSKDSKLVALLNQPSKLQDLPQGRVVVGMGKVVIGKEERTVFVGNVAIDTTKKDLCKVFRRFGEIEKVRFRSVPLIKNKLSRKANFILKNIDSEGDSMNAYITYKQIQSARKAVLEGNGTLINGKHLRITMEQQKHLDYCHTVFVGNLPFNSKQEDLRSHFAQCGDILSVRLIRNKEHQGIGIGFVTGKDKETLNKMREMQGTEFMGRKLRVKKAVPPKRLQKKRHGKVRRNEQRRNDQEVENDDDDDY